MKGVYILWSPSRRKAYVGESINIGRRLANGHRSAILLGAEVEVRELPEETTLWGLRAYEVAVAEELRARQVDVVNRVGVNTEGRWGRQEAFDRLVRRYRK